MLRGVDTPSLAAMMVFTRAASCSGLRATTIWMVEQLGLAMMPLGRCAAASRFTSGTTSGTAGSMRHALELSVGRIDILDVPRLGHPNP